MYHHNLAKTFVKQNQDETEDSQSNKPSKKLPSRNMLKVAWSMKTLPPKRSETVHQTHTIKSLSPLTFGKKYHAKYIKNINKEQVEKKINLNHRRFSKLKLSPETGQLQQYSDNYQCKYCYVGATSIPLKPNVQRKLPIIDVWPYEKLTGQFKERFNYHLKEIERNNEFDLQLATQIELSNKIINKIDYEKMKTKYYQEKRSIIQQRIEMLQNKH